ncbi:MAG: tRNA (adenosine(37)-N6)-threonylcarbamoyltransferase complex dimerization subunit type 1 TsaB [Candidatus Babeliales bacterium]|nr:tRNA (adenosine(37)-N6)-threonylcarbamoyltransferase complex dimerization subunit type 1 TsaB [Candidatus Babeliales bacterium]
MTYFLAIQNTYNTLDIALFKNNQVLETAIEDKTRASKNCVLLIADMLHKHSRTFADLSFIAVNQGPGPFTTLRTIIATANGLSFASGLPLIGIDGLDALMLEHQDVNYPNTVTLLNAYNKDVFFSIGKPGTIESIKGYGPISIILEKIKDIYGDQQVQFLGNGAELYTQEILAQFGDKAIIPHELPHTCSVQQIGLMGLDSWNKQEGLSHQLFPLYLKIPLSQ